MVEVDAYLEEELYDLITFCIQNPTGLDLQKKKVRVKEIGFELYSDGGLDTMESMYHSITQRIKEEIHENAKAYRSLWNGITDEWKY